ncbi:DUF1186 domain-containing protein [Methylobacterium marchantiae]|uniref:DUF1186 domain-containing protein n=1 Tax=Methylobacterium marchantiae TaxID=600331 RepID=A0ABW3WVX8_9HYPH|nr:hypothetical protein AIGOOFII_1567 [Methylobacterium marchantiae]
MTESPGLIEALSAAKYLPKEAMLQAVAKPSEIAETVLAVLALAADGEELDEGQGNLLFWGLHVLGTARETRVFAPLMRLLQRQDADTLDALLGDALTTTMAKVIVSVFDGDVEPIQALLLDSTVDGFARNEVFAALAYLTQTGRIDRNRTHDLLVRFDDKRAAVEGDVAWVGWEETIALLGFADLAMRSTVARADGRLTDEFSDAQWFHTTLRRATAKPADLQRFDPRDYGTFDDPIADLSWTAEGAGLPVRNPVKIGRNDPCPCGSGKKYKKCCLSAA